MKQKIVQRIKSAAQKAGITLMTNQQVADFQTRERTLLELATANKTRSFNEALLAECVIFSMDRPTQLDALLYSYFDKVQHPVPVYVLYATSSNAMQTGYEKVAQNFAGYPVELVLESRFQTDLIALLNRLQARKMFFLVDDDIFIEDVDMHDFCQFNPREQLVSLRLAPHLNYCYTRQVTQPVPTLEPLEGHADKLTFNWGQQDNEWSYPMSVEGHLFDTLEITAMSTAAPFKAPNSYEGALMQFYHAVKNRAGICYKKSKIVNIPANKVQTENDNVAGDVSPQELLEKFMQGWRIDPRPLYGAINTAPHEEHPFTFTQSLPPLNKQANAA